MSIYKENLERVNTFKYLGATLAENGDLSPAYILTISPRFTVGAARNYVTRH